jgi:Ion channel
MHRQGSIAQFFRAYPFGILLIAILVMIVGAPISAMVAHRMEGAQGPSGLAPLTVLLTLASSYAVWNRGNHRRAVGICIVGGILIVLGLASLLTNRQRVPDFAHLFGQTLFLAYVTVSILRTVFRARVVDGNILCGAACVYLLAGALWGYSYAMLEVVNHDSFHVVAPDTKVVDLYDEPGWLIYFSYTTLTTVGFGDILPANALGRSLSVLEAVVGQIMLVVMMARLVGLHVAHSTTAHHQQLRMTSDENK